MKETSLDGICNTLDVIPKTSALLRLSTTTERADIKRLNQTKPSQLYPTLPHRTKLAHPLILRPNLKVKPNQILPERKHQLGSDSVKNNQQRSSPPYPNQ
jgi:hypothetical protein